MGYGGKEWKKEKEEEQKYIQSTPMDLQQDLIVAFGQSDDQMPWSIEGGDGNHTKTKSSGLV